MKELFFKVLIAEKINVPLSTNEMRTYPTFKMYLAEYHEKLINVMYKPAYGFKESDFIKLMTRKLCLKYKTTNVEYLENQKTLQSQ